MPSINRQFKVFLSATLLCWLTFAYAAEPIPQIVVSIPPLQSLVLNITDGTKANVETLIQPGVSPHTFSLRPKQAHALQKADLVVWIGPELENFLAKPLQNLTKPENILTLISLSNLTLYPARTGGEWHDVAHNHDNEDASHTSHSHTDPHIWLDPLNAKIVVAAITERLIQIEPHNAALYKNNLKKTLEKLNNLDKELKVIFKEGHFTPKTYMVLHDSYQYLEKRYGLNVVGVVAINPHRPLSAKALKDAQETLRIHSVTCVLQEPEFNSGLVNTLIESTSTQNVVLYPLGKDKTADKDSYFKALKELAYTINECHS